MKIIKTLLLFTLIIASISQVNAQNEERTYFFTTSIAVIDDVGKKAIVTNVQSTTCKRNQAFDTLIKLQLNDYLKSKYTKYYKYGRNLVLFKTKSEAEIARNKEIANLKSRDYSVTKDIHFTYYCKN